METWRAKWVEEKINVMQKRLIQRDHYTLYYAELTIIVCSIISAFAAELWPGKNKDRKRFIELLINYAKPIPRTDKISIPLLIDYLTDNSYQEEARIIRETFFDIDDTLVIHDEYDKTEKEILEIIEIPRNILKFYSYANILYTNFRSSYVHQYEPGGYADSFKMTEFDANVSYINWMDRPHRRIHFHVNWYFEILRSIGQAVDSLTSVSLKDPQTWWIES